MAEWTRYLRMAGQYLQRHFDGVDHFLPIKALWELSQSPWPRITPDSGEGVSVPSLYLENYNETPGLLGTIAWDGADVVEKLHRLTKELRELRSEVATLKAPAPT